MKMGQTFAVAKQYLYQKSMSYLYYPNYLDTIVAPLQHTINCQASEIDTLKQRFSAMEEALQYVLQHMNAQEKKYDTLLLEKKLVLEKLYKAREEGKLLQEKLLLVEEVQRKEEEMKAKPGRARHARSVQTPQVLIGICFILNFLDTCFSVSYCFNASILPVVTHCERFI